MEFVAATKDGIFVYDANAISTEDDGETNGKLPNWAEGHGIRGKRIRVVAAIPSPQHAFGHGWSADGTQLASVCSSGVRLYDATAGYTQLLEIPNSAPEDIATGGTCVARAMRFSPKGNFLVVYEKWDPKAPDNCHVWGLTGALQGQKLHTCRLNQYVSGAVHCELIQWTHDESISLELKRGEGLILCRNWHAGGEEERGLIAEPHIGHVKPAPTAPAGDGGYIACYVPEAEGRTARVAVYHLGDPSVPTATVRLPAKIKECKLHWNPTGTVILALATSEVDESNASYFGSSYLYWIRADGTAQTQVYSAGDGLVQDVAWSPSVEANEFMVIVGLLPATVALHSGSTGKLTTTLGVSRRNELCWNPWGRLVTVAGFGTLPGDLDVFDNSCKETVASFRAELTVGHSWAPDGKRFIACTVAPRMNEGNQLSIWRYNGDMQLKMEYKLPRVRHEDDGAGARTATQAYLYAASWRPYPGRFEDAPVTPRTGGKRPKGLPDEAASRPPPRAAYRAGGEAGSSVAAMMRGEIEAPEPSEPRGDGRGWDLAEAPKPLEPWEIKKLEKEKKKAEELKAQQEKEAERQKIKDVEKEIKDEKKLLKQLKEEVAEIEKLEDKEWDELTEEDEAELERMVDIRARIAELEGKGVKV